MSKGVKNAYRQGYSGFKESESNPYINSLGNGCKNIAVHLKMEAWDKGFKDAEDGEQYHRENQTRVIAGID